MEKLFPYNIVLIGFMGSGKSTIGNYLSKQLEMEFFDVDTVIQGRMGIPVRSIFENYGEPFFRKMENAVVKELSERENTIISCGGGVVLDNNNISNLKTGAIIILLKADAETIYYRLKGDKTRPLLKDNMNLEYIKSLMKKRKKLYDQAADIIIHTDNKEIDEICKEIILMLSSLDETRGYS